MTVHFLTIVLDGMPWIACHYPIFRKLPFRWHWHIVEGVAAPVKDTAWCNPIPKRLSNDGTTQYMKSISFDHRITVYQKPEWRGKVEMVNAPLKNIKEPCLLWQVDSDELWDGDQIATMRRMFLQQPERTEAMFYCRYFVGPDIITTGEECYGNNSRYEWRRVWRFTPGRFFKTHEPPILSGPEPNLFSHKETSEAGLVFDHMAYATEATVAFKEKYYGRKTGMYKNAVKNWKRLQSNQDWPVKLHDYLPWVDELAGAERI